MMPAMCISVAVTVTVTVTVTEFQCGAHTDSAMSCHAVSCCVLQVFVAAHTSAGKTVVAEYAFALAGAHASRYGLSTSGYLKCNHNAWRLCGWGPIAFTPAPAVPDHVLCGGVEEKV
jgi:hypothetical protein